MDPPAMINGDAVFRNTVNATPFNHADIWQLPVNGGESGDGLGLRRPHFAQLLRRFPTMDAANLEASGDEMSAELEQRGNNSAAGGVGVGGSRKRRDVEEESARGVSTSNGVPNGSDGKRPKTSGCKDHDGADKAEAEPSSARPKEQSKPTPEPPKQDYIHVRARRGQATDSHSLAERARREKISERMKVLQDLVPGCNKVIGKALVLDEIINYIQSLQRQVEFLSMKLEAVTTGLNPGIEVFPSKDFGQQSSYDTGVMPFGSQAPREYIRGSSPEWLHMQVGGGFERTT